VLKRLPKVQCAHPRQGSKSAGLFANNVFEYGRAPADAGFREYSDMFRTQAKTILRERVRNLMKHCAGAFFSRSSRSSSQPQSSNYHLQKNTGGNPKPFGSYPDITRTTFKNFGSTHISTPFSIPSGLLKRGRAQWGALSAGLQQV
jgi:hypothetical protein